MKKLSSIGTHLGMLVLGVLLMKGMQQHTLPSGEAAQPADSSAKAPVLAEAAKDGKPSIQTQHHGARSAGRAKQITVQIQEVERQVDANDNFKVKTQQTLLDLSHSDPIAALSWLLSEEQDAVRLKMAYPFERLDTVKKIFEAMPSNKVSAALDLISGKNDDALLIVALCAAASGTQPSLSREAILGNLSFYATSDAMSEQLRNSLLSDWTDLNPQSAQAWALQERNLDNRNSAIITVAEQLLKSDPLAAIQWAKDNLSNVLWPGALESLVASWIENDPPAVATWLQSQTPSHEFDTAIRMFALKTRDVDPETALSLSSRITDESLRHEIFSVIQSATL